MTQTADALIDLARYPIHTPRAAHNAWQPSERTRQLSGHDLPIDLKRSGQRGRSTPMPWVITVWRLPWGRFSRTITLS